VKADFPKAAGNPGTRTKEGAPSRTTRGCYLDEKTLKKLPPHLREMARIDTDKGYENSRVVLSRLTGDAQKRIKDDVARFIEDLEVILRPEFVPVNAENWIFINEEGDLLLKYADKSVKVRARHWEFSFLFRKRFEVSSKVSALFEALERVLKIPLVDSKGEPLGLGRTIKFSKFTSEVYVLIKGEEGRGILGGRFDAIGAFFDGKLLLIGFQPMMHMGPFPSKKKARSMDPKELVFQIKKARGKV
jgi:hypothetical protein